MTFGVQQRHRAVKQVISHHDHGAMPIATATPAKVVRGTGEARGSCLDIDDTIIAKIIQMNQRSILGLKIFR